jgi:hypothetical protein
MLRIVCLPHCVRPLGCLRQAFALGLPRFMASCGVQVESSLGLRPSGRQHWTLDAERTVFTTAIVKPLGVRCKASATEQREDSGSVGDSVSRNVDPLWHSIISAEQLNNINARKWRIEVPESSWIIWKNRLVRLQWVLIKRLIQVCHIAAVRRQIIRDERQSKLSRCIRCSTKCLLKSRSRHVGAAWLGERLKLSDGAGTARRLPKQPT